MVVCNSKYGALENCKMNVNVEIKFYFQLCCKIKESYGNENE